MNKGDLKIERLQQYLDRQKGVVESNIKEYNQQLEKNYLYFFGCMPMICTRHII